MKAGLNVENLFLKLSKPHSIFIQRYPKSVLFFPGARFREISINPAKFLFLPEERGIFGVLIVTN